MSSLYLCYQYLIKGNCPEGNLKKHAVEWINISTSTNCVLSSFLLHGVILLGCGSYIMWVSVVGCCSASSPRLSKSEQVCCTGVTTLEPFSVAVTTRSLAVGHYNSEGPRRFSVLLVFKSVQLQSNNLTIDRIPEQIYNSTLLTSNQIYWM